MKIDIPRPEEIYNGAVYELATSNARILNNVVLPRVKLRDGDMFARKLAWIWQKNGMGITMVRDQLKSVYEE